MAIERYDENTGIKNVQIGDYDWIENLFADYITPGATGYTEGLLSALQLFFKLYLNDPRNLYSGLNVTGDTGDVYKVRYSAGDLEGYLGDKIKTDALSGITLTVDGTSNQVMKIALNINESSSTSVLSILQDSKTLKKFKAGTGINITSTSTELEVAIDESWLEGITYGIKYSWNNETEMLAEVGMNDADLGVRNDLGEVWKYNVDTWEYFFDLGTSTTNKTTVSSIPDESVSGTATTQSQVNTETVVELESIDTRVTVLEDNPSTGSGQFPLQWVYEDFGGVDGKFNINNTDIKISKKMFTDEAKTTFVDMSSILSDLTTGNSMVLVDEQGNKALFTFNVDFTDEGTYFLCDDYTETGVFTHNIGEDYNFQLMGLSSGSIIGSELSGCSFNIPKDTASAISIIGNTYTRLLLRDSNDVATVKTIGTDLSYNSTLDSIKNYGTESIDVSVDFNVDVMVYEVDDDFNVREYGCVVGLVSSNGTVVCESDGGLSDYSVDGTYSNLNAFKRYKNHSGSVIYSLAPNEELNLQSYLDSYYGTTMRTYVRTASINVIQVGNSVSSGTSDTRFLSTYEATYDGTDYPIVPTTNGEVRWTFSAGNVIFNIFKENVDGETVYNLSNITVGDLVSLWVLDNPTSRVIEVDGFTDNGTYWTITGLSKTNSGTFIDGDKIVIEYEPSGGGLVFTRDTQFYYNALTAVGSYANSPSWGDGSGQNRLTKSNDGNTDSATGAPLIDVNSYRYGNCNPIHIINDQTYITNISFKGCGANVYGTSVGISYEWDNETEMLAETGMVYGYLGLRKDLQQIWFYNEYGNGWVYFEDADYNNLAELRPMYRVELWELGAPTISGGTLIETIYMRVDSDYLSEVNNNNSGGYAFGSCDSCNISLVKGKSYGLSIAPAVGYNEDVRIISQMDKIMISLEYTTVVG